MADWFWNYSDTLIPFLVLMLMLGSRRRLEGYGLLFTYLVVCIVLLGYSNYLADRKINNMYLYHIYSLVEVALLLTYLYSVSGFQRKMLLGALVFYVVFWILNLVLWEHLKQFNSNSASMAALVVAGFAFLFFLRLVQQERVMYFQKLPSFWIVSGLLFYSIASILVLGSYKYKDWFTDLNTHVTWRMQQVANLIRFGLISIGILCSYKQSSRGGSL